MFAIRDDRTEVSMADFEEAYAKIQSDTEDDEVSRTFA
jgi:proteasome regulatory subunit